MENLNRNDFLYHPFYCEENIWHLCQNEALKRSYVVYIISEGKSFPMINQRGAPDPEIPLFWDYHVILLVTNETNRIIDFDTQLPFVNDVAFYCEKSFIDDCFLDSKNTPQFRLVPSDQYVSKFSSNRKHMRTELGWSSPPPDWPTIGGNLGDNLADFVDMANKAIGEILTREALVKRFG